MPWLLASALLASLLLHLVALFGPDIELFDPPVPEPLRLEAQLQPLPPMPASPITKLSPSPAPRAKPHAPAKSLPRTSTPSPMAEVSPTVLPPAGAAAPEPAEEKPREAAPAVAPPPEPVPAVLPTSVVTRYAVFLQPSGFEVGRAEHRWQIDASGDYVLTNVTETSGLAAFFKSARVEQESRGRLGPKGLMPEQFRVIKQGREAESARFDWSTAQLTLGRQGTVLPLTPGAQDLLSLHYQLAYLLPSLPGGVRLGVATGRKFERYAVDALGEETLETRAGTFRTLHLRAQTDTVTEIWVALDRQALPVKIRFTDRKGDIYEQIATEIGRP